MIRVRGINETQGLSAVDDLTKITMEECVFHIKLVDGPRAGRGKTEHHVNSSGFDKRTECLRVVDARLLSEAA